MLPSRALVAHALSTGVALLALLSSARADLLAEHAGCADPISEGWSLLGSNPSAVTTMALCDPPASWAIDDDAIAASLFYRAGLDPDQINLAETTGWRLTAEVSVLSSGGGNPPLNSTISFGYRSASTGYDVWLSLIDNTDIEVKLVSAYDAGQGTEVRTVLLTGAGAGPHTYELLRTPGTGVVRLMVDGIPRVDTYVGAPLQPFICCHQSVFFGAASAAGLGEARWSAVRFEVLCTTPPGDIDGDQHIGLSDLAALLAIFGSCDGSPGFNPAADLDESGCVDLPDLAGLLSAFGSGCE